MVVGRVGVDGSSLPIYVGRRDKRIISGASRVLLRRDEDEVTHRTVTSLRTADHQSKTRYCVVVLTIRVVV